MNLKTELVQADQLIPHPRQDEIFPGRAPSQSLIDSIKTNGIIEQISIAADGMTIISGHRRAAAALIAGVTSLNARVYEYAPDSAECTQLWLDANLEHEELSLEQKGRLFILRESVEAELAKKRSGQRNDLIRKSEKHENGTCGASGTTGSTAHDVVAEPTRAAAIAAESLGISRDTASRLKEAILAKDEAAAAGDEESVKAITKGLSKSARAGQRAARKTKLPAATSKKPAPKKTQDESKSAVRAKLRAKAKTALGAFVKALAPELRASAASLLVADCGVMLSESGGDPKTTPHTPEELVNAFKELLLDLTTKDSAKAVELVFLECSGRVDIAKLLPTMIAGKILKPTVYLGQLPDSHSEATELVETEFKIRTKQLKGFEQWELNGRAAASRKMVKAIRKQVKDFENHCAVGSEEQPALIEQAFPEKLDTPEFRAAWNEWWDHRKKAKKSITDGVRNRQLNILGKGDADQATAIVSKATEAGWKGIPDEIWNTEWCGRPCGRPATAATAAVTETDDEISLMFLDLLETINRYYLRDLRNTHDVIPRIKNPDVAAAAERIGFGVLSRTDSGDKIQRLRFKKILQEVRAERGAA